MANDGLVITRVDWNPRRALEAAERLSRRAVELGAEHLLNRAAARVPYRTGELAGSGEVQLAEDGSAAVAYTAEHARPVRARGVALGGRSAHWLDEAMNEEGDNVGRLMADTIKSGWPQG